MWRKISIGGLVLLLIVVGVIGLRWLVSDPLQETADAINLEDEWANTIRKIGIEPVFPPEEDLTVGDVLAVVVKDNKPDEDTRDAKITAQTPLPKRAIKLAHIDVRDALTRTYSMLPIFIAPNELSLTAKQAADGKALVARQAADGKVPAAHQAGDDNAPAAKPANDGVAPAAQPAASDSAPASKQAADAEAPAARHAADGKASALPGVMRNFMLETNQGDLPRAAFPKLKIQGSASASSGLGASLRGFVGYATGNTGLEELFLTEVRTYGLPSADAAELLKTFCTADKTKHVCRDATARRHLERIVGDDKDGNARINQQYISDKKGSQRYRIRIDIVMVNRVYLARAIRNLNQSGSAEGARVTVTVQPSGEPAAKASPDNVAPAANADRVELEAMRKRLQELEKQSSGTTGGSASYGRSRDREALLNEAFDRPVAIGYRSVRFMPDKDDEP